MDFGIRKKPIPDPGSGSIGQKGTGTRILDPQHQRQEFFLIRIHKKYMIYPLKGLTGKIRLAFFFLLAGELLHIS
jgi:hypothetical protein